MKQRPKTQIRLLSTLFDLIICLAFAFIIMLPSIIAFINVLVNASIANIIAVYISAVVCGALVILFALVYSVVFPILWKGQTIGKRFFRIKLVNADGSDVTLKTLFIRETLRLVLLVISLGASAIGDLASLTISKSHRSFSDIVSSTYVINVDEETQGGIDYGNTTH
jgi:uncharacterized RDD family membrane protein YckC